MLRIGPHKLPNPVVLAPMAGITDLPFRRLCMKLGAGLAVSEMVNSNPGLRATRKTRQRCRLEGESGPRPVQIAGSDPALMAAAARYNVARGAQIIDINMGCPAKKVCRRSAGSALLADEGLVADILRAVVGAVDVPVTLKIRTGISPQHRNGVSVARIAEDAGIAALAVHGRTRSCAFRGEAEYDTIAAIVAATDFPVFANGDIDSPFKAAAVIAHTGAAGVMIGRAARGRPWLPGQIAAYLDTGQVTETPSPGKRAAIVLHHVEDLHAFYGDYLGVRIARKHVGWYLQGETRGGDSRRLFNSLDTPAGQLRFLEQLFEQQTNEVLAA